jgi:hypothetical protein
MLNNRQPRTFEAEHRAAGSGWAKLPDGRQYGWKRSHLAHLKLDAGKICR